MAPDMSQAVPRSPRVPREPRISQTMSVGRAATLLSALIMLSRLTGFARGMVMGQLYGAGPQTDAYNAAFNVPDTLNILIAGGALATGFVPIFSELLTRGEAAAARRTFRATLTLLSIAFGLFTLALFALTWTPWGKHLALSTGQAKPETIDLYLRILRVLLLAQFLMVLGGLFSGALNAMRLFVYPALQPVMFNSGMIAGALLGRSVGIESQAWGALVGAFVGTVMLQLPVTARNGLPPMPLWDMKDPGVRRVLTQLPPIVFGLASGQIIGLNLPRFFAGALPDGQLSSLNYANILMQAPLDLLASGTAIALYPTLTQLATQNQTDEVRTQLANTMRRVLLLILGATALIMALAYPLVHLVFERGKFTREDTLLTSNLLWCYGLCLPGLAAQQFLARGFYAVGETRAPVRLGVLAMAAFLVWGAIGTRWHPFGFAFQAQGLALGAVGCTLMLGVGLFFALRARLSPHAEWDAGQTPRVLARGTVAALLTYLVAWGTQWSMTHVLTSWDASPGATKYVARVLILVIGAAAGGATFVTVARALGVWSGVKTKPQKPK